MPSIRATVTTDDAAPNEAWPAASTAAVERGVTDRPNPRPKRPSAPAASAVVVAGDQRDIAMSAAIDPARPMRVTSR